MVEQQQQVEEKIEELEAEIEELRDERTAEYVTRRKRQQMNERIGFLADYIDDLEARAA